jgi:hypothetical protein
VPDPGPRALIRLGALRLLVLDEDTARRTTVGELWGTRRLLVGDGLHVVPDGELLHLECGPAGGTLLVHPAPAGPVALRDDAAGTAAAPRLALRAAGESGIFARYEVTAPPDVPGVELVELAAAQGPAPQRTGGSLNRAAAPTDTDYARAAAHRVVFDRAALTAVHRLLLRIDWVGDAARAEIGGALVADQYWNGAPWEIDLTRHRRALAGGAELVLRLLPFDPAATVYVPEHLRPAEVTLRLDDVRLVPVHRAAAGLGAP